jgi:hypothetical protein
MMLNRTTQHSKLHVLLNGLLEEFYEPTATLHKGSLPNARPHLNEWSANIPSHQTSWSSSKLGSSRPMAISGERAARVRSGFAAGNQAATTFTGQQHTSKGTPSLKADSQRPSCSAACGAPPISTTNTRSVKELSPAHRSAESDSFTAE